jgi:hypothetical protein
MKKFQTAALCTAIVCAGCANRSDPPLIFGAGHTYGVSVGAGSSDTGGEFVVGYKGTDIALIPVSAIQPNGNEELVGAAAAGGHGDSYSVLGQFGGSAAKSKTGANAGLGKFFATGAAARNIAEGYANKMGYNRTSTAGCKQGTPAPAPGNLEVKVNDLANSMKSHVAAQQRLEQRVGQLQSPNIAKPAAAAPARDGARLVFAQYDYFALALDGSAADQSVKMTLGFKDKNLAIIPVLGRDSAGNITRLGSSNPGGGDDAYSVLGQFESNNSTDSGNTNSTLNSFFSTGAASQILSTGFMVKLCDEYK